MFEKNLGISRLLDFYGSMLTDRKRDVLELYYNEDLSLGEIADNIGISRQGVRDLIKKADVELVFFEENLKLAARYDAVSSRAEEALRLLEAGSGNDEAVKREILGIIDEITPS